jgi:hypothetical protein
MNTQTNVLQVYKDLAECYERRGQAPMRDRFLVLAADAALSNGQADEAERVRARLLQVNPHHMLKPYHSFQQAREAPDVDTYVRNLRLNYPLEVAADLLRALNASDDPNAQKMQVTAPLPTPDADIDQTLHVPDNDEPIQRTLAWNSGNNDDPLDRTAALPPPAAARPTKQPVDIGQTAPLPRPAASQSRVPTRADVEHTEPAPRPVAPRPAPAPRSAAPAPTPRPAATSKPAAVSRPVAPKAPLRPAPGPSPFASLPEERSPARTPGKAQSKEDEPVDGSGWLASVLVVLVGLLGLSFVGYVIARPFLP